MNFDRMWKGYPKGGRPCKDENNIPCFENQCAIRLGEVLKKEGFAFNDYEGAKCWQHNGEHILRAEELAKYLDTKWKSDRVLEFSATEDARVSPDFFAGDTGIICFYDFYGDGNTGDHIDLWNGEETTSGPCEDYFERAKKVTLWLVD